MRERKQTTLLIQRRRDLLCGVDEVCTKSRRTKVEAQEEFGEVLTDEREVRVVREEVTRWVRDHGERYAKEHIRGVNDGRVAERGRDAEVGDMKPLVPIRELDEARENREHCGVDAAGRDNADRHSLRLAWADSDGIWEDGNGCSRFRLWDGAVVREAGPLYSVLWWKIVGHLVQLTDCSDSIVPAGIWLSLNVLTEWPVF